MTIKLYCFGESGNAYKAALALELSGLDWEPVKVDFFGGETRTPEYRKTINEMGEVPVMVDGDLKLTQSGVIQDYVAEKSGKFGGADATDRREILRWVLWDNHKLSGQAGTTRFLMNFLPPEKRPEQVIGFLQGRLRLCLDLGDLRSDLVGLADQRAQLVQGTELVPVFAAVKNVLDELLLQLTGLLRLLNRVLGDIFG